MLAPLRGRMRPPAPSQALGMVTLAASAGCSAHGWALVPTQPPCRHPLIPCKPHACLEDARSPLGRPLSAQPPRGCPSSAPSPRTWPLRTTSCPARRGHKGLGTHPKGPGAHGQPCHSLPTHKFGVLDEPPGMVPGFSTAPDRHHWLGARPVAVLTGVSAALPAAAPLPGGAARPRLRAGTAGAAGLPLRPFRRLRATGRS